MGDVSVHKTEIDVFGFWSILVDQHENKEYAGRCVHQNGKGTLTLIIDDDFDRSFFNDSFDDLHFICGFTNKGKCTIPFCRILNFTSSVHGAHSITFSADYLFVGHEFNLDENIFNKFSFRLSGLYEWLGRPIFNGSVTDKGFNINYNSESACAIKFKIDSNTIANLKVGTEVSHDISSGAFNTDAYVEIETDEMVSYFHMHKSASKARGLMCMLYGFAPRMYDIKIGQIQEDGSYKIRVEVHIPEKKHSPQKSITSKDFLIRAITEQELAIVADIVFNNFDEYVGILYNLIDIFSDDKMPIHHVIYKHIQNIEVMSRKFHNTNYCEDSEFVSFAKEYKKIIKEICPSPLKGKMISGLRNINEYTLKDKIIHAIKIIESNTSWKANEKYEDIVDIAVNLRNELTHHIVHSKTPSGLSNNEVLKMIKQVSFALLCNSIGVPWNHIERGILNK